MAADDLELGLRGSLRGKSLLCEVPFEERQCEITASVFRHAIEHRGAERGRKYIVDSWPVTYALWLANEAFFSFQSGAYWPHVLAKLGIENTNRYSSRFGHDFLYVLDVLRLPRFKRLKTRWSYLGPILAHAGIPRSCLPEFFERVLPKAIERDVSTREGFAALQEDLGGLYLGRPTEWFIRFGDAVAEDFVRRAADLYRARANGDDTSLIADRLPMRTFVAFDKWWISERRGGGHVAASRVRRPTLVFDPWQGLRLSMPSQPCDRGSGVLWRVQADTSPSDDLRADRLPGETQTEAREAVFAQPIGSLTVRLVQGAYEKGLWIFPGLTRQQPVLFFDPESSRVLSRSTLDASLLGVVHPIGARVNTIVDGVEREASRVSEIGRLRFGWSAFTAIVVDCTGCDEIRVVSDVVATLWSSELRDVGALPPRLIAADRLPVMTRDGTLAFDGRAPFIEVTAQPGESADDVVAAWIVRITPISEHLAGATPKEVPLRALGTGLSVVGPGRFRIDLGDSALLGANGWGRFDVSMLGAMGRDATFHFVLRPKLTVTHDWSEWRQGAEVTARVEVPAGVRLVGANAGDRPRTYIVRTVSEIVALTMVVEGFKGLEWTLPYEVHVPTPSWALFDSARGSNLLAWSRSAVRVSVAELEGRESALLLRTTTPWGNATSAEISLRGPAGDIIRQRCEPDAKGFASVDLSAFLTAARQQQAARLELRGSLQLSHRQLSLSIATLEREWLPTGFRLEVTDREAVLRWDERFAVDGRCVRVLDLLRPWRESTVIRFAQQNLGQFACPIEQLLAGAGVYRVSLSLEDEWNGTFRDLASAEQELGGPSQWTMNATWTAADAEGTLYRLLVEYYAARRDSGAAELAPFTAQGPLDGTFAEKVLRARVSVGLGRTGDRLANKLSRLLRQVPVEHILQAVARLERELTPAMLLQFGMFTWPGDISAALSADDMEALWRMWPPLGAWVELRCVKLVDAQAEERLLRIVGSESLRSISPVVPGGRLRLFDVLPDVPLNCHVVEVLAGQETNPFTVRRMQSPTVLVVETTSGNSVGAHRFALAQTSDGRWTVQFAQPDRVPASLSPLATGDAVTLGVGATYPEVPAACEGPPELQIVHIIRAGMVAILREQLALCSPLPGGPIGGDAFMSACFDWAIHAASDGPTAARLSDLCRRFAIPLAREAIQAADRELANRSASSRIMAEMLSRSHRDAEGEPLLAVHLLSWIVALSLVWRGTARPLPFFWPESITLETALTLYECAPRLLEHDIAKVCLIEMMVAAKRTTSPAACDEDLEDGELDGARPGQTDE